MKFNLVDRIEHLSDERIVAVKYVSLAEEYLADHFPTFPVMPGVLMLQTLVEAGSWLLRVTDDFRFSVIVLREAKGIKYGTFMQPGNQMRITVELLEQGEALAELKGKGEVEGNAAVSARLTLCRYNLSDRNPGLKATDERIVRDLRKRYQLLRGGLSTTGGSEMANFEAG